MCSEEFTFHIRVASEKGCPSTQHLIDMHDKHSMYVQEQVYMKMACPGVVRTLATTPNAVYCAAAVAEKIHIWEVSMSAHIN